MIERLGRREQLLDQAAEVSRAGLRTRRERILASARPILHTSVAAAGAWLIAHNVLGHPKPFFAPVWRSDEVGMVLGDRVDWAEVDELVTESYCALAPKSLSRLVQRPPEDAT